jgi:hypothetical protein
VVVDQKSADLTGGAALTDAKNLQDLLALAAPQPALPGLADDIAADDFDAISKAAANLNEQRRARGRPKGSANLRNAEMFDYLEARGFKAPEMRLMEIVSADPVALTAALFGEHADRDYLLEMVKLQAKCAVELMPYKFAKRQEIKVDSTRVEAHVFVAGRLTDSAKPLNSLFVDVRENSDISQVEDNIVINQQVNPIKAAD